METYNRFDLIRTVLYLFNESWISYIQNSMSNDFESARCSLILFKNSNTNL